MHMKFQVNILSSPGITRGTDRPTDRQTDRPTLWNIGGLSTSKILISEFFAKNTYQQVIFELTGFSLVAKNKLIIIF